MALASVTFTHDLLAKSIESGEELKAWCYGIIGLKGHAIGLTNKRLLLIRLSLFLSKPKETTSIPLGEIQQAAFAKQGMQIGGDALIRKNGVLDIKTNSGMYHFTIMPAAGLNGGENIELAEKLAGLLPKA